MQSAANTLLLLQVEYENAENHVEVTKIKAGFVTEGPLEGHREKHPNNQSWICDRGTSRRAQREAPK